MDEKDTHNLKLVIKSTRIPSDLESKASAHIANSSSEDNPPTTDLTHDFLFFLSGPKIIMKN